LRGGEPQFRWTAFPEATTYRIRVASSTTGEIVMTELVPADQLAWNPTQALASGETYEWEVEALRGEQVVAKAPKPPEPEARFAVISEAELRKLDQVLQFSPRSHLVAGVAYAQAGLLDEATAEFAELAKENPESEIPKRLIEQIKSAKSYRLSPTTTNGAQ
jgi:hypothetical protein